MDLFAEWQAKHNTSYPRSDFHGVRHSATTYKLAVSNGDIKAVQQARGQASPEMVAKVYSHIEEQRGVALANKIEKDFYSQRSTSESDVKQRINQITSIRIFKNKSSWHWFLNIPNIPY